MFSRYHKPYVLARVCPHFKYHNGNVAVGLLGSFRGTQPQGILCRWPPAAAHRVVITVEAAISLRGPCLKDLGRAEQVAHKRNRLAAKKRLLFLQGLVVLRPILLVPRAVPLPLRGAKRGIRIREIRLRTFTPGAH